MEVAEYLNLYYSKSFSKAKLVLKPMELLLGRLKCPEEIDKAIMLLQVVMKMLKNHMLTGATKIITFCLP